MISVFEFRRLEEGIRQAQRELQAQEDRAAELDEAFRAEMRKASIDGECIDITDQKRLTHEPNT